MLKTTIKQ